MIGLSNIPLFEGIEQYNKAINISRPVFEEVDVRRFEENMKLVPSKMEPFRNSFYQVSLVMEAGGHIGQNEILHDFSNCTLFFNIPGQIIKWDIVKNWLGFYASFRPDLLSLGSNNSVLQADFPFLQLGEPKFFDLNQQEALTLFELYEKIYFEYSNPSMYNKPIIQSYLSLILQYGKRFYKRDLERKKEKRQRSSLTHRFEEALTDMFKPLSFGVDVKLKTVGELAEGLYVSPKHLSDVLKDETGKTAIAHIHNRIINHARGLLNNTSLPVSEVAYQLGFENPPYFSRLFKKYTSQSPSDFRRKS